MLFCADYYEMMIMCDELGRPVKKAVVTYFWVLSQQNSNKASAKHKSEALLHDSY
jgi:hypothetical protein